MTYPTRLRDEKLGVPLIVPLGEGLETPDNEQHVARDLLASVMYKPVKVIALGRVRFFTTTSPWSLYEPIVLEVYSEDGERIWTNPFIGMTLEEAIACLERGDRFLSKVSLPVAKSNSVRLNRQVVDEEIRNLVEQGCPDEEIQAHLILTRGMDQMVIDRLIHAFRSRTEYSAEIQALVRHCARLFAPYFEGEELCRAVAEASGQGMDVVQGVLKGRPLEF